MFAWDEEKRTFIPAFSNMRVSGLTGESMVALASMFIECGILTRSLQEFVHHAYSRDVSPGRVALADTVTTLLSTIQARLSSSSSMRHSFLQLQGLFTPTHSILKCFQRLVDNASTTRNDESMLSTIYQEMQLSDQRTDSMRAILLEVLAHVSQPWLDFCGQWLGLHPEMELALTTDGPGKSFVKVETREWVDERGIEIDEPDFVLDLDRVPSFISPEDARIMFEVGKSLRLLRAHHSYHPLARPDMIADASPPTLTWQFSWDEIMQIEAKALQYESDLLEVIQLFKCPDNTETPSPDLTHFTTVETDPEFSFLGKPEADMEAHLLASIDVLNESAPLNILDNALATGLNHYLVTTGKSSQTIKQESLSAPISLVPMLSFNPIISAQARVVNGTCMRMLFMNHNLREHLNLQHSFHLLGNGVFSSKLSHSLFDPDLETAERHRGVARSGGAMGLRLGGRDTWPPASSELRLALMGLLSESYVSASGHLGFDGNTFLAQSLPGDLSFAVRDMSEPEIERCMNPNSIEALDFL